MRGVFRRSTVAVKKGEVLWTCLRCNAYQWEAALHQMPYADEDSIGNLEETYSDLETSVQLSSPFPKGIKSLI